MRKLLEHDLEAAGLTDDDVYFCSLSSRTMVYKGQLTPAQARGCALLPSVPSCKNAPISS